MLVFFAGLPSDLKRGYRKNKYPIIGPVGQNLWSKKTPKMHLKEIFRVVSTKTQNPKKCLQLKVRLGRCLEKKYIAKPPFNPIECGGLET